MRGLGAAAVCAMAVAAGTIASRKGKAMAMPSPRRTWRRERCFFVMNMGLPPGSILAPVVIPAKAGNQCRLQTHERHWAPAFAGVTLAHSFNDSVPFPSLSSTGNDFILNGQKFILDGCEGSFDGTGMK